MKLAKALKNLSRDELDVINGLSRSDLKAMITDSSATMQKAEEELEANEKYQALKESLKDVTAGKREVFTRQKSIITVCLACIGAASDS